MSEISDKLKQIAVLNSGGGIQSILNAAYNILGNPILMHDTEYRLQAYTSTVTDDPLWNEIIAYGSFSHETQVFFKEAGFIDAVANAKTPIFLSCDELKYERISGKLYNENNIHVSNLTIVACHKPFSEDDPEAFEVLCSIVSEEIIKSEFYETYGRMYQETYIRKLIDGEITDKGLYAAHIAIVYNGFKSGMRLIVADIGVNNANDYSKLTYFRDLFRRTQGAFEYAIYLNYILILINSDDKGFDAKRNLGKIYELCQQNSIYCGVSNSFENLYELKKHYLEAVAALKNGIDTMDGLLFLFEEIDS